MFDYEDAEKVKNEEELIIYMKKCINGYINNICEREIKKLDKKANELNLRDLSLEIVERDYPNIKISTYKDLEKFLIDEFYIEFERNLNKHKNELIDIVENMFEETFNDTIYHLWRLHIDISNDYYRGYRNSDDAFTIPLIRIIDIIKCKLDDTHGKYHYEYPLSDNIKRYIDNETE